MLRLIDKIDIFDDEGTFQYNTRLVSYLATIFVRVGRFDISRFNASTPDHLQAPDGVAGLGLVDPTNLLQKIPTWNLWAWIYNRWLSWPVIAHIYFPFIFTLPSAPPYSDLGSPP